jgi:MarR family transcriptional regulator, organic hydroperoxide resistance regulator
MDETLHLDEYNKLWQKFSQTRAAIIKARQKRVGKYFHPNWGVALTHIWAQNGQATPGMLTRALYLEHHSVSELIDRLEKKGLVKRTQDTERKNTVRLSITEKGRQECFHGMQTDFITGIMSSLSGEQRKQFSACLTILHDKSLNELGLADDIHHSSDQ